jgi:hypothetical protein
MLLHCLMLTNLYVSVIYFREWDTYGINPYRTYISNLMQVCLLIRKLLRGTDVRACTCYQEPKYPYQRN